jgi:hypothetical protein
MSTSELQQRSQQRLQVACAALLHRKPYLRQQRCHASVHELPVAEVHRSAAWGVIMSAHDLADDWRRAISTPCRRTRVRVSNRVRRKVCDPPSCYTPRASRRITWMCAQKIPADSGIWTSRDVITTDAVLWASCFSSSFSSFSFSFLVVLPLSTL